MKRTFDVILGIVFSVLGFGIIYSFVSTQIDTSDEMELTDLIGRSFESGMKVSWATSGPSDGLVTYTNGTKTGSQKSYGFGTFHEVMISDIKGTVAFNATSCTMAKQCTSKEGLAVI